MLTAEVPDPTGLGRIVRDGAGAVVAIVEERDASDEQRAIREINAGVYVGDAATLRRTLADLGSANDQGEQYVTDVLGMLAAEGAPVGGFRADDPDDVLGCNDQRELAERRRMLNDRVLDDLMRSGVTVIDPRTTWVDVTAEIAPDAVLQPGTQLQGATTIATGAVVGPDTTLLDCEVGEGASVVRVALPAGGDRPGGDGRPVQLPAPGHPAGPRRQGRRLRRDQERRDRRRLEGPAPVLRRRRDDRASAATSAPRRCS